MLLITLATQNVPRTRFSIPSVALNLFAALAFCPLSHFEHTRSVKPSSILTLYLLFSCLFDVARTRTLWTIEGNVLIAGLFTTTVPVKFCILLLECWENETLFCHLKRLIRLRRQVEYLTKVCFGGLILFSFEASEKSCLWRSCWTWTSTSEQR